MLEAFLRVIEDEFSEDSLTAARSLAESLGYTKLYELLDDIASASSGPPREVLIRAKKLLSHYREEAEGEEGFLISLLASAFYFTAFVRMVKSSGLGFLSLAGSPEDVDVALESILLVAERDTGVAKMLLEKFKDISIRLVPADLAVNPAFYGILFLLEMLTGNPCRASKALVIYSRLEAEDKRLARLVSAVKREIVERLGMCRDADVLRVADALIAGAANPNVLAVISELLDRVYVGEGMGLLEYSYLRLISLKLRIVLGDEAKEIVPEVGEIRLFSAPGSYEELREIRRNQILASVLTGSPASPSIGNREDAVWVMSQILGLARTVLRVARFAELLSLVRSATSLCLRFWEHMPINYILATHDLLMTAAALHGPPLLLDHRDFLLRVLTYETAMGASKIYAYGIYFLSKAVNMSDDPKALAELAEEARGYSNPDLSVIALLAEAKMLFLEGRVSEAAQKLLKAEEIAEEMHSPAFCLLMLEVANAYLRMGLAEEAARIAEGMECRELPEESLRHDLEVNRTLILAEIAAGRGDYAEAEKLLKKVDEMVGGLRLDSVYAKARADIMLLRASMEATRGNFDAAIMYLEDSIRLSESLGLRMPPAEIFLAELLMKTGRGNRAREILSGYLNHPDEGVRMLAASVLVMGGDASLVGEVVGYCRKLLKEGRVSRAIPIVLRLLSALLRDPEGAGEACELLEELEAGAKEFVDRERTLRDLIERAKKICNK